LVVDERSGELGSSLVEAPASSAPELERVLHKTVKKVLEDTENLRMNTGIAQMMIFVNEATSAPAVPIDIVRAFLRVLAPYAPHICEELWSRLGETELIAHATWPEHDEALCVDDQITIVIQVNGKKRGEILVDRDADKGVVQDAALASDAAQKYLGGQEPKRVIVVPGRLVNIVV
jgi:leucyl-tRNA synthetase